MFEPMELTNDAVIKVIGVGGGGGNAVEHMVRERIEGVEFFAVNTDAQALRKTAVGQTIQIGNGITKAWEQEQILKLVVMPLKKIVKPCAMRLMGQTWSLLLLVWVVVRAPAQPQLWPKLLKSLVS